MIAIFVSITSELMYNNIMSEEVDMNVENKEDVGVKVKQVDCSDAFNTSQFFATRDEVLHWTRSVAHEIKFVVVRMRASFMLIACERSGEYRLKKNDLVRICTSNRKCGCPFKLRVKSVLDDGC
ncbi:hypothetical protein HKD37_13G036439 [Glycine soja]